jgi:chromosomal replication initiator protein
VENTTEAPTTEQLREIWRGLVDDLQPNQRAWFLSSEPVTLHETTAIIAVPNEFTRTQLEGRLRTRLEDSLSAAFGNQIRIAVTVDPQLDDVVVEVEERDPPGRHMAPEVDEEDEQATSGSVDMSTGGPSALETRLNPKYRFETFVIGSSNRFPHAAAVAVAEAPGKAYNPLLVYGDSGLGKTHLLHAIGHYVRSLYRGAKVRYVSSEEFTNEFINSIKERVKFTCVSFS